MATPNEKLAESLAKLKVLQEGSRRVFRSNELSRIHRERLMSNGFLQEVLRGWLISAGPGARVGDSTPWYASFWEFCTRYCNERSPECFIRNSLIHTGTSNQKRTCFAYIANHSGRTDLFSKWRRGWR